MMEKECTKCKGLFPSEAFGKRERNPSGLRSWCKKCEHAYNKELRTRLLKEDYLGTRLKERRDNLKRCYGISLEDYDVKLKEQNGVCDICGLECSTGRRLAVDHDHSTGKIRSLLCGNCNKGLGKFQDNPELLIKAADYLRKHSG